MKTRALGIIFTLFWLMIMTSAVQAQIEVSGTIAANTTWGPAGATYRVTGNVTVNQGVTLTVQPGVRVEFVQQRALFVIGKLVAVGTSAQPIRFTGATEGTPGWWGGVYVTGSGSAELEHCTIAYAGSSTWADSAYRSAGLYRSGSGDLTLKNSTLDRSSGAGLQLEGATGIVTSSGNTFSNNNQGVRVAINTSFEHDDTSAFSGNTFDVYLNGGTMTGEVSWYLNPAFSLHLSDTITVAAGARLRVLPGTVVKAAQNKALFISGTLEARGEAARPIAFTDWRDDTMGGDANGDGDATAPAPGWWGGVYVTGSGSAELEHCTIAYAGSSTWADSSYRSAGLYKSGSGGLTLKNSTLDHSSGAGLFVAALEGKWLKHGVDGDGDGYLYSAPPTDARTSYFIAPEAYHGDWRNYSELRLSLWSADGEYYAQDTHASWRGDIYLASGDKFAYAVLPRRPAEVWDSFTISLTDPGTAWVLGGGAGSLADVLANVTAFHVRAKHGRGTTYAGIDRVELRETPHGAPVVASNFPENQSEGWVTDIGTSLNPSGIDRDGSLISAGNTFSSNARGIQIALNTSFEHDDTSTFSGNAFDVFLNGGTMTGEVSWYLNPAYSLHLSDTVTVAAGARLRVLPGTVVKADRNKALFISGTLEARGEAARPIAFTDWRDDTMGGDANGDGDATTPAPGWWGGVYVTGSGSAELEHCTIAYAGSSTWADSAYRYAGLYRSGSGDLTLKNSTLDRSSGAGLQLEGPTGIVTSSGNTFSNNTRGVRIAINTSFEHDDTSTFTDNTYDVYLNGGTMTGEVSWYLNPAYSMHLSDTITVAAGARLRVLPGTVVKADRNKALFINGTLEARGEAARPVAFTDWRDDTMGGDANGDGDATAPAPGWWGGILVTGGGSAELEHCAIAYAGASAWADSAYRYAGLYMSGSGDLDLKHSTVRETSGSGLFFNSATGEHSIERNTFSGNTTGVLVLNQPDTLLLSGNLIEMNTDFGLRNQNSAQVDARNNWWGDATGPRHAANPDGQGDTVSDGVLFEPWRTTPSAGLILSPVRSGTVAAGDVLRFSGSAASVPDAAYRWNFSDRRGFSERSPGLVTFPQPGTVTVTYSAMPEGSADPYPDSRDVVVVPDTGNLPDLRVTQVNVSGSLAVGQPARIDYSVRNAGRGPAAAGWVDGLYLSRDAFLDIDDLFLGSVAVNQDLPAGQSYQQSIDVTLPAVDEGAYHLILVVNEDWRLLEMHRLNNEQAVQVTAQVPTLEDGVSQSISYPTGRVGQYFRMTAASGQNLLLDATDLPAGLEALIRYGALPTLGAYEHRLPGGERFVIPAAAAGNWYMMVHGNVDQGGAYTIRYDMVDVALTRCSPSRHGTLTDLELTLAGAGFKAPLDVALVSGTGAVHDATVVEVDSHDQAVAIFPAGTIPAGMYTVRVAKGGSTATLPNALDIVEGGLPNLEVNLILPARFGYHILATVYVEYANTGNAPMPAPLLLVTAAQNGRQGAILTLDETRLSRGFWSATMPEGFAPSVQFIASGAVPGVLQPGESRRMPVYYAGWQKPWDFSYPPFEWQVGILDADDATPVDWPGLKSVMRPDYIPEDAWEVVWSNFTALTGATWGDYVAMLSRNASYLHRHGQRIEEIEALQAFTFRQAEGFSPMARLAGGMDAFVPAPGMPMVFERSYLQQISRRFVLGPLGRGWTHNWQMALRTAEDGAVIITDQTGTPRIFQPDSRYTGRYLAQPGDEGDLRADGAGFRLTELDGTIQSFSAAGKLVFVQDLNGNRITCEYSGDLLTALRHSSGSMLTIAYDGAGRIASVADHHGRRTSYAYTGEHLTSVEAHDGRVMTYSYDTTFGASRHALLEIGLPDGTTRGFSYDQQGRLGSVYRDDAQEQVVFAHTGIGRVDVTDALENTSRFFFDHWGRMFKTENALGDAVQMAFDDLGNLIGVTGPDGLSSSFAYDRRGNMVEARDSMQRVTRFSYSRAFNRLASVTDALNNRTEFAYDEKGNLRNKIYPDGRRESWTFDAQGSPVSWTSRQGTVLDYGYDAAGRITSKAYADGSSAVYRYDDRGNLLEAENERGATSFTYNEDDYLIKVAYPGEQWLEFTYDAVGRRTSSTDQLGHRVEYQYDAAGRLQRLSDASGDIVTYAYDELGRMARATMGNGVYAASTYDPVGRLLSLTNHTPDDQILSRFSYSYDRRGRRTTMQTHYGIWTYGYDDAGQLIQAVLQSTDPEIPDQDLRYEYDALGNRVQTVINGTAQPYVANTLNQYIQVGDRTLTYDLNGNLIREEGPDGSTEYAYNQENRLTSVTRGGVVWEYAYDALGHRVAMDENGVVTHFVLDPVGLGNVVGAYDNTGNLTARYTHGFGLISRTAAGSSDYYTYDPMGNTSELTGPAGILRNAYAYRPFGETLLARQAVDNPFHFMGEFGVMVDPAGLHYVRARHLDAQLGRFTAMDPIGFLGGDVNLYRYALSSPLDGFDPTGLSKQCAQWRGTWDIVDGAIVTIGSTAVPLTGPVLPAIGIIQALYGGSTYLVGDENWVRFKELPAHGMRSGTFKLFERGVISRKTRNNKLFFISVVDSSLSLYSIIQLSTYNDVLSYLGDQAIDEVSSYCPHNQQPVSTPETCIIAWGKEGLNEWYEWLRSLTRSSQSRNFNQESLACMPLRPGVFGDTGLAASHDPNQKISVAGFGDRNFLRSGSQLNYRIDFENLESATAPAQIVTIRDPLSPHLDLTTFELGALGFGDMLVAMPPGLRHYQTVVDYAFTDDEYDFEIEVHIEVWLENGMVHANFFSCDPEASTPDFCIPPQDVGIGFLPPDLKDPETEESLTGRGQGYVTYLVRPKPDLASGTEIRNIATIQFDFGLSIDTNQIDPEDPSKGTSPDLEALVTFDAIAPSSRVSALPAVTATETFTVSWSGEDDEHGSGVGAYDIYSRENSGPWAVWLENTPASSAAFTGENGKNYAFYSVATDNVGNREIKTAQAEAATRVDVPPASHTVTFRDHDGTLLKTMQVDHGGRAVPPADPVREGHVFIGWSASLENVTGDLTVTARYASVPEGLSDREWLTSFYVAYWGRAADPGGMDYWLSLIAQGVLDVPAVAENFALSAEAKAIYPYFYAPETATDAERAEFLLAVYRNLLNREVPEDDGGVAYWVGELREGRTTPGAVIGNIIYAAIQLNSTDWLTIWHKIQVAEHFTDRFAATGRIWSEADLDLARQAPLGVTDDPGSVEAGKARVEELLP